MERISEREFILRAIEKLRKPPYKGIHSVYSGLNRAFREYFQSDPVQVVKSLEAEGVVVIKPVKGGVMIYFAGEVPQGNDIQDTIAKILS